MGSGLNGDSWNKVGVQKGGRERKREFVKRMREGERESERELEAKVSRENEAIEGRMETKRNCVELVP